MIKLLLLSSVVILLTGCDLFKKKFLERVEELGKEMQQCLVNQVLKDDCDDVGKKLKIIQLELEIADNPPTKKQTKAAFKLGKLKVKGDPKKSIYSQVRESLNGFPSQLGYKPVELTDTNFLFFTSSCYSLPKNNWQRFTNRFKDKKTFVLFYKVERNCFDITELQESFSILTEEQIDGLNTKSVEILKFQTFEDAEKESIKYK